MTYVYLAIAVIAEVAATSALKASEEFIVFLYMKLKTKDFRLYPSLQSQLHIKGVQEKPSLCSFQSLPQH